MAAESIGKYPTIRVLGEGAMGTVYLARDPIIGRLVAIKVLRTASDGPAARARLLQEARAAGCLTHPNIVSVFDVDEERGQPYVVMEYVEGQTLATIIRDRIFLTVARKLLIMEHVCSALACAHDAGLVHRDIKPTNIMVDTAYEPRVVDFGLAKIHDAPVALTQEHAIVGTLCYMAPEQLQGGVVDHRSDLFAVAAVAYELLTGRRAFAGHPREFIERLLHRTNGPTAIDVDGLDPAIVAMLMRGLDARPYHRFQSAREFEQLLREIRRTRSDAADDSLIESTIGPQESRPAASVGGVPLSESPIRHRPVPSLRRAVIASLGLTGMVTLGLFAALDRTGGLRTVSANDPPAPPTATTLPAPERVLAAGTELKIGVLTRLDSRTAARGEPFAGVLFESVFRKGQLILPTGTRVEGRVDRIGTDPNRRPFMKLILTGLVDDATLVPINADSSDLSVPAPENGEDPRPLLIGGSTRTGDQYHLTQLRFTVAEAVRLKSLDR